MSFCSASFSSAASFASTSWEIRHLVAAREAIASGHARIGENIAIERHIGLVRSPNRTAFQGESHQKTAPGCGGCRPLSSDPLRLLPLHRICDPRGSKRLVRRDICRLYHRSKSLKPNEPEYVLVPGRPAARPELEPRTAYLGAPRAPIRRQINELTSSGRGSLTKCTNSRAFSLRSTLRSSRKRRDQSPRSSLSFTNSDRRVNGFSRRAAFPFISSLELRSSSVYPDIRTTGNSG